MKKPAPTHEQLSDAVKASGEARMLAFGEAGRLLAILRETEAQPSYKRGKRVAEIKAVALQLLSQCGTPPPLVVLLGELLKLPGQKRPPQVITPLTHAQWIAAAIEAKHPPDPKGQRPSDMNYSELHRALVKEMADEVPKEKAPHRTTVRKWDKEPAYWEAVYSSRPGCDSWHGQEAFKARKV